MHNAANVYLWGTHVGTVSLAGDDPIARFQYTDEFRGMGVEVSPLRMPLSSAVFSFPDLPVYVSFASPHWLCRAGDFRSMEEASEVLRQIREMGIFREAVIVKSKINVRL